ncbi:hypothetical protein, partial [Bacteroides cellulosilyticus]|uniref:hypothetical protein n=1 Tax=Bacteroides cellulosilyticus TaxID=246787 RepID=UPI0034A584B8
DIDYELKKNIGLQIVFDWLRNWRLWRYLFSQGICALSRVNQKNGKSQLVLKYRLACSIYL